MVFKPSWDGPRVNTPEGVRLCGEYDRDRERDLERSDRSLSVDVDSDLDLDRDLLLEEEPLSPSPLRLPDDELEPDLLPSSSSPRSDPSL